MAQGEKRTAPKTSCGSVLVRRAGRITSVRAVVLAVCPAASVPVDAPAPAPASGTASAPTSATAPPSAGTLNAEVRGTPSEGIPSPVGTLYQRWT